MTLSRTLQAEFAFIGRLDTSTADNLQTLGACSHGEVMENFSYRLSGTPCERVVGREPCHYPHIIQHLFPEDTMLVEMGIES